MAGSPHPVWQYSLATLLAIMLLVNLGLAYVSLVGVWGVFLAVVPPLFIGGLMNAIWAEHWSPSRPGGRRDVRVLAFLATGFLIWLPILAGLCLKP